MATLTKCPVCEKNTAESTYNAEHGFHRVQCSNCGAFRIGQSQVRFLSNGWPGNRQLLAHWIRKRTSKNHRTFVDDKFMELVHENGQFPSAHEQEANLLLALGDGLKYPGHRIQLDADFFQARTGAATPESFGWLLREIRRASLVTGRDGEKITTAPLLIDGTLTLEGWQKYSELKRSDKQSRLAFMAMPFGNSEIDDVVKSCFRPAVSRAGFELKDVTDGQPAGLIDDHIRVAIRRSKFMVCELTDGNHGAYWEAGFAEGLGIPVIYTCREDKFSKIHFDTSHLNTIKWRPSALDDAATRLTATIRATLPMEAKMDDEP